MDVTNAKLHYADGTIVDAQLRDRKNVREAVSHGEMVCKTDILSNIV